MNEVVDIILIFPSYEFLFTSAFVIVLDPDAVRLAMVIMSMVCFAFASMS